MEIFQKQLTGTDQCNQARTAFVFYFSLSLDYPIFLDLREINLSYLDFEFLLK